MAIPVKAELSDSVPPLVKKNSEGRAPMREAMDSRAVSRAAFASLPNEWILDAFPKVSVKNGVIAWTTRLSIGVVAV